jgi:hypothetical protein
MCLLAISGVKRLALNKTIREIIILVRVVVSAFIANVDVTSVLASQLG